MKTRRFVTPRGYCALGAVALLIFSPLPALGHDQQAAPPTAQHPHAAQDPSTQVSGFVKVVRDATERFRDVAAAEAEGYALLFGCVSGPDTGAMGLHFVNLSLVGDGELDATRPEIVIYEPMPNGRRRLIGADYLVLADAWHAKHQAPPELGGQLLHLFESPNRFGLPSFYTLHVWAWKENPNGAFVNWHPKVSCHEFTPPTP